MITTLEFIFIMMLVAAFAFYGYLVVLFSSGWAAIPGFSYEKVPAPGLSVSIVVPLRNEEGQVRNLLDNLRGQDLPADRHEIILVDDHSDDNTVDAVTAYLRHHESFPARVISLPGGQGKKQALHAGIVEAKGDIILTTDADCSFERHWAGAILSFIERSGARMVCGPVLPFPGKDFHEKFQELEFLSLVGSGAGASGAGKPFLCNGANLAFYRQDFFGVGGYDSHFRISSGDDVFLLHSFKERFGKDSIRFLKSEDALVRTPLQPDVASFFNQRKRWASKSFYYRDLFSHLVALSVFLVNLMLLLGFVSFLISPPTGVAAIAVLLLKAAVDLAILLPIARFAGRTRLLYRLPIFEILYVFYSIATVFLSLVSKYEWKGRSRKI